MMMKQNKFARALRGVMEGGLTSGSTAALLDCSTARLAPHRARQEAAHTPAPVPVLDYVPLGSRQQRSPPFPDNFVRVPSATPSRSSTAALPVCPPPTRCAPPGETERAAAPEAPPAPAPVLEDVPLGSGGD